MRIRHLATALAILASCFGTAALAQQSSQPIDPSLYSGMRWRLIGPYRAGRVTAVAGISGDPSTYYMGTPGGGVWKTTDAGEVWFQFSTRSALLQSVLSQLRRQIRK